jgi:hypothetical protein
MAPCHAIPNSTPGAATTTRCQFTYRNRTRRRPTGPAPNAASLHSVSSPSTAPINPSAQNNSPISLVRAAPSGDPPLAATAAEGTYSVLRIHARPVGAHRTRRQNDNLVGLGWHADRRCQRQRTLRCLASQRGGVLRLAGEPGVPSGRRRSSIMSWGVLSFERCERCERYRSFGGAGSRWVGSRVRARRAWRAGWTARSRRRWRGSGACSW